MLPSLAQDADLDQTGQKPSESSCNRPCCSGDEAPHQRAVAAESSFSNTQSSETDFSPLANFSIPIIGDRAPATAAEAQAQAHAAFLAVSRGFSCHWEGCMLNFLSQQDLLSHIVTHAAEPLSKPDRNPFIVVSQPPPVSPPSSIPTATVVTDKPEEIVPLLLQNQSVSSHGSMNGPAPTVVVTACTNPSHHIPANSTPRGSICMEAHPHVHHHDEHRHAHMHAHGEEEHSSDSDAATQVGSGYRKRRGPQPAGSKKRKGSTIEDASDVLDENRKYPCDESGCEKTFKRSGHLKRHKLIHQPRDARQRFHCSQVGCAKNYSTKYDLAAHIRQVHMGMLLFKCSVRGCCRRFVRQDSLVKHLTTFDHSKQHASTHREEGEFTDDLDLNDVLQAAQVQVQMAELQQQHLQQQQQQQQQAGLGLVPVNIFNPFSSSASSEFLNTLHSTLSAASSGSPAPDSLDSSNVQDMRSYANLFQSPQ